MAVLSLAALVSSSTAVALPMLLNAAGQQELVLITGLTTADFKLTRLAGGVEILCELLHFTVHINANSNLGPFHFDFLKCKNVATGVVCTGEGEANAGEILALGEVHLVYDSLSPLGAAGLFLVNEVLFKCSALVLAKVKGEVLCLVTPLTKTSKVKVLCEQTAAGDPKETKYWNAAGTEVTIPNGLLSSLSESAFEMSAQGQNAVAEGTVTNDSGVVTEVTLDD
jgi:hypothetical protein